MQPVVVDSAAAPDFSTDVFLVFNFPTDAIGVATVPSLVLGCTSVSDIPPPDLVITLLRLTI